MASVELTNFVELDEPDLKTVWEWRNHDNVRSRMFGSDLIPWESHLRFVKSLKNDQGSVYWKAEDLGVISLKDLDPKNRSAYLGIYKNPENSEKGAAIRLMRALMEKAFDEFGLHTLKLEVLFDNRRAITFYNKCGFNQEGRLRDALYKENGKYIDLIVMGITEEEYRDYNDWNF